MILSVTQKEKREKNVRKTLEFAKPESNIVGDRISHQTSIKEINLTWNSGESNETTEIKVHNVNNKNPFQEDGKI